MVEGHLSFNGFRKTGVCPLNKHAIEIIEHAEDSISESQSMDDSYPGTSSTPPPASNNDQPSTSFGLSDSNWNSPVSGDVPVGANYPRGMQLGNVIGSVRIICVQKKL